MDFSRTFTGKKCRKKLPKTARLRVRFVRAGPRRKTDFQTCVLRNRCSSVSLQGASIDASHPQNLRIGDSAQFVHDKLAIRANLDVEMGERAGRWPGHFCAIPLVFASMTRTF